jgi:HlyD family secretion protein
VETAQTAMMLNTDPFGRIMATQPDTAEMMRTGPHGLRRHEYKKVADGQRAVIRVESMPEKQFLGHVRSVSAVASQADSWISDVKLYQTYVIIDGELLPDGKLVPLEGEHIKPDMTAEVTISVDAVKMPVITAPIQAIIGGAEMGATREVFVKTPTGFERRDVVLGLYNDRMVEIRTGLVEGDEIVVNPKALLGDKDRTRTREAGESKDKNGDAKERDKPSPGGDPSKAGPGKGGFPGGGEAPKGGGKKKKGGGGGFPGGGGPPVGT